MAASPSARSCWRSGMSGHPICHLVERHGGGHGDVQRLGAVRAERNVGGGFGGDEEVGGKALALRAEAEDYFVRGCDFVRDLRQWLLGGRGERQARASELGEIRPRRWPPEERPHARPYSLRRERVGAAG